MLSHPARARCAPADTPTYISAILLFFVAFLYNKRLWFLAASIIKRQGGYLAAGNFLFSKYVVQFKTILFKEVGVHVAVLHDGMGGKHSCRSVYLSVLT